MPLIDKGMVELSVEDMLTLRALLGLHIRVGGDQKLRDLRSKITQAQAEIERMNRLTREYMDLDPGELQIYGLPGSW